MLIQLMYVNVYLHNIRTIITLNAMCSKRSVLAHSTFIYPVTVNKINIINMSGTSIDLKSNGNSPGKGRFNVQ